MVWCDWKLRIYYTKEVVIMGGNGKNSPVKKPQKCGTKTKKGTKKK